MQHTSRTPWRGLALLILFGTGLGIAGAALGQAPTAQPVADKEKDQEKDKTTYSFEMDKLQWSKVIEWFADKANLQIQTTLYPTGSFSFKPAKDVNGKPLKYTIPEIIDILNDALQKQNYTLLRNKHSLWVWSDDKKIPANIVPEVTREELKQRGKTEIVRMLVKVSFVNPAEVAVEMKRVLGPFGEVEPLPMLGAIQLQGRAWALAQALDLLDLGEKQGGSQAETLTYQCKWARAHKAEEKLKALMPDVTDSSVVGDKGSKVTISNKFSAAADEMNNTVFVTGAPKRIATAKVILAALDKPGAAGGFHHEFVAKPWVLKQYNLNGTNAAEMAGALQDVWKTLSKLVTIKAIGNQTVMVYASPDDQMEIAENLIPTDSVKTADKITKYIPLLTVDSATLTTQIQKYFPDPKNGGPIIDSDGSQNAIIIIGTNKQVTDVTEVLDKIVPGGVSKTGTGKTASDDVILQTTDGSAVIMGKIIAEMLKNTRKNPVIVNTPGLKLPEPPMPKDKEGDKGKDKEKEKTPKGPDAVLAPKEMNFVAAKLQLVDPQQDKKKDLPGDENAPVIITAIGNKLQVECKDKATLLVVQQMINMIKNAEATDGDFEVIRLKHADAVETAKVLDEIFNGKPGQMQFPGINALKNAILGTKLDGGAKIPKGFPGSIRIVADPSTNSLIVKAGLVDMMTIKELVARAIDVGDTDSNALMAVRTIGPLQNVSAKDMSDVIQDAFKPYMASGAQANMLNGFKGMMFPIMGGGNWGGGGGQGGQPPPQKKVTLTIAVDDKNNMLVINSPKAMYDEIKELVTHLDKLASNKGYIIQIVQPKIDPMLLEQAVKAIQGYNTSNYKTGYSGYMGGGGGMPGGGSPFGQPGGGGMFAPGGGGGGFPGGGFGKGGGFGPGGGFGKGGGKRGGGGSGFFAPTVKDDRQVYEGLYDPQDDVNLTAPAVLNINGNEINPIEIPGTGAAPPVQPVLFQDKAQPDDKEEPKEKNTTGGFKGTVTVEPIPALGLFIIKVQYPEDMEQVLKLIELIQSLGQPGEIQIEMVHLEKGDCVNITYILNQLFSRVNIGASSTTLQFSRPGGVPGPGGGPPGGQPGGQPGGFPGGFPGGQPGGFPGQPGGQPGGFPGGFPGGQPGGVPGAGQIGTLTAQAAGTSSVVMLPIPRLNSILIAGPRSRMDDVKKEIKKLDVDVTLKAVPFALKNASAQQVVTMLQTFYATRYGVDANLIHFTSDPLSNIVYVQAGPADLEDIRGFIWQVDNLKNGSYDDMRIVPLRVAYASDLAQLLAKALAEGVAAGTAGGSGVFPTLPGGTPGGFPGGVPGGIPGLPGGTIPGVSGPGVTATTGTQTKTSSIRFFSNTEEDIKKGKTYESGILQDVRIIADPRTNSLILAAHSETMLLLLKLIENLDVPPAGRSIINVYLLKNADATAVATQLQQLFLGGQSAVPATPGGIPGLPGTPGTSTNVRPPLLVATGAPLAPLIDLRLTVDQRTNSIIVAGSQNDLDIIQAIIYRLDDTPYQRRLYQVIKLRNAIAADVAQSLNDFLSQGLTVDVNSGLLTGYQVLLRQVVIVPESVTNSLLVNATQEYFDRVMNLVTAIDILPPQVMIQSLIAEVTYDDLNEFGVELGFQSPVLFTRSLVPGGATVNGVSQIGVPGFNFNPSTGLGPLGNSTNASPSQVGLQGLGNLGVGRVSSVAGVGGFVFSAASESVSILVRALRQQHRLDVLSAPKVMTADNQAARVFVGQNFPYIKTSTTTVGVTAVPTITNGIDYQEVGVQLQVTPKVNPDGSVVMRVVPTVSAVAETNIPITTGVNAVAFDVQTVETTVIAQDGETIVLGGLIKRINDKTDTKIPYFGDLPVVGALFRYRQQQKKKTELLIILTPHIVRCRPELDRILSEEGNRMNWIMPDVLRQYGPHGMEPLMPGYEPPLPGFMKPPPVSGSPYLPFPTPWVPAAVVPDIIATPSAKTGPEVLPTPAPGKGVEVLPPPIPEKNGGQTSGQKNGSIQVQSVPIKHETIRVPIAPAPAATTPAGQPQGGMVSATPSAPSAVPFPGAAGNPATPVPFPGTASSSGAGAPSAFSGTAPARAPLTSPYSSSVTPGQAGAQPLPYGNPPASASNYYGEPSTVQPYNSAASQGSAAASGNPINTGMIPNQQGRESQPWSPYSTPKGY